MKRIITILFILVSLQTIAQDELKPQTNNQGLYVGLGYQRFGTIWFLNPSIKPVSYQVVQINLNYVRNNWNIGTSFGRHSFGVYLSRKIF